MSTVRGVGGDEVGRRLADICGDGFTRPAGLADGVAGARPTWVAAPGSAAAVGELLRLAADRGLSVVPRGAGTKLDWGVPPSRLDVLLDTGRLAGIRQHAADGLTVEVGAGTPLRAVRAELARTNRRVPLDVPSADATVGGVVAADEAGPMRHRHGSPCDRLAALSYVDAHGRLNQVGGGGPADEGAGADLGRLLCGSQGALGVLVSATLRVQPIPASRIWVTHPVWTPLEVHRLVREILGGWLSPAAVEVNLPTDGPHRPDSRSGPPGAGCLTVLLEGGPADVGGRVARLTELFQGEASVAGSPPSWWGRYPFRADDVALRIDVPLSDLHAAVYALRDAAGAAVPVRGSAGVGVVHAALPGNTPPERVAAILAAVRGVLLARAGRCVVLAAPARVRQAVDLWGELPTLPLLRQTKKRFDPAGRLAPGRFTGGL